MRKIIISKRLCTLFRIHSREEWKAKLLPWLEALRISHSPESHQAWQPYQSAYTKIKLEKFNQRQNEVNKTNATLSSLISLTIYVLGLYELINLLFINHLHDHVMKLEKNSFREILLKKFLQYPKLNATKACIKEPIKTNKIKRFCYQSTWSPLFIVT